MQPIEQVNPQQLAEQAEAWREEILEFARALIRTPSPSGQEGALVDLVAAKMHELGYDEVYTDELGNLVGRMRGQGTGPSVLFSVHLDSTEAGERSHWQFDPYAGDLADGFLHGRGASDHKAALAAMVYGGAILKRLGVPLRGDFILGGVVQQNHRASIGMRYLVDKTLPERGLHYDLVVLGNPTNLDLYLGHRGRVELEATTIGRTCHAGAPWLGANAVYKMLPVIAGVQELATTLPSHPFLEKSTLAVTTIEAAPGTADTIPDRCAIALDRRFLPSETVDEVVWQVQSILSRLAGQDAEFKGDVHVRQTSVTAYTGTVQTAPKLMHPFITESHHAFVEQSAEALQALGQSPRFGKWTFTTDGGYPATIKNITTFGYAPGDERFALTPFDRVQIDKLIQAAAGYAAISQQISG